jgi:Zn-dependent protease with chaperone function
MRQARLDGPLFQPRHGAAPDGARLQRLEPMLGHQPGRGTAGNAHRSEVVPDATLAFVDDVACPRLEQVSGHTTRHRTPGAMPWPDHRARWKAKSVVRGLPGALRILAVVGLAVACASPALPPIDSPGAEVRPGDREAVDSTGADVRPEDPEADQRRLWLAAQEAEDEIAPPGRLYDERGLQQYLDQIADRLTPSNLAARGERVRVRVRRDPRLNASALAHGTLVVHTGLVARAENEAQLAGVLAHEIAHVIHRHHAPEARAIRDGRAGTNLAGFLALLAATTAAVDQAHRGDRATADAIAPSAPPLLSLGLNLAYTAMVSGYSHDLEREADREGLGLMASAGYDPREMVAMLRTMREDGGDRGSIEAFFWASQPRLAERIETVERLASEYAVSHGDPIAPGMDFDRRVQWVRVTNAQYDAYMGRVALARRQIAKAASTVPGDARPVAEEIFRGLMWGAAARGVRTRLSDERTANEAMGSAMASLERATTLASPRSRVLADVYRIKGVMLYDWWETDAKRCQAKLDLETYLLLRPDAADADAIQARLADLHRC